MEWSISNNGLEEKFFSLRKLIVLCSVDDSGCLIVANIGYFHLEKPGWFMEPQIRTLELPCRRWGITLSAKALK